MTINQNNICLEVILGLSEGIERKELIPTNDDDDDTLAKIIQLPSKQCTVTQLTKELVEKHIPHQWLLQMCMHRNEGKKDVIIGFGCDTYAALTLNNISSDDDKECNKISQDTKQVNAFEVSLKIGKNFRDSVTLSSDDFIYDYINGWKLMPCSGPHSILSDGIYLWLDIHHIDISYLHAKIKNDSITSCDHMTWWKQFDGVLYSRNKESIQPCRWYDDSRNDYEVEKTFKKKKEVAPHAKKRQRKNISPKKKKHHPNKGSMKKVKWSRFKNESQMESTSHVTCTLNRSRVVSIEDKNEYLNRKCVKLVRRKRNNPPKAI